MQPLRDLPCPKPNQIKTALVLLESNQLRLYCPQSNYTPPTQPPYILEGVRACGKAVPGRYSRLCQSNNVRTPGCPVQGHNHLRKRLVKSCFTADLYPSKITLLPQSKYAAVIVMHSSHDLCALSPRAPPRGVEASKYSG